MTEFRFFYGLNFAHRVYLLADGLSKALQWENISVVEGKVTVEKTPENIWKNFWKHEKRSISKCVLWEYRQKFEFMDGPILQKHKEEALITRLWANILWKGGNLKERKA